MKSGDLIQVSTEYGPYQATPGQVDIAGWYGLIIDMNYIRGFSYVLFGNGHVINVWPSCWMVHVDEC